MKISTLKRERKVESVDITRKLGEGFVALRVITEAGMALSAKVDPDARGDIEVMLEKVGEVQEVFISLQEELMRQQQENHRLQATVRELEAKLAGHP